MGAGGAPVYPGAAAAGMPDEQAGQAGNLEPGAENAVVLSPKHAFQVGQQELSTRPSSRSRNSN